MMKTYVVQFPPNCSPAIEAVVDAMLRAFELAIKSSSTYRWLNLGLLSDESPRWFDTDCENAAVALKLELSNVGVQVFLQPPMQETEAWERAAQRCW